MTQTIGAAQELRMPMHQGPPPPGGAATFAHSHDAAPELARQGVRGDELTATTF
ncbi:MAG: hypothetical protein HGA44_01350 [Cellulomonadaceae bacterium]|nr:hypothetical protein [Cellulomonadaceae bacterium]